MSCISRCKPCRDSLFGWALWAALAGGCATRGAGREQPAAPLVIEVPDLDLDAEVFVDGNYVGQVKALRVPETGPILLAPGVHRVEVRKPGRFPVQRTVEVAKQSNAPVVVRAELLEDPA